MVTNSQLLIYQEILGLNDSLKTIVPPTLHPNVLHIPEHWECFNGRLI